MLGGVNPTLWVPLAELADRAGFDSVWMPEHLVLPAVMSGSPHHGAEHPPIPPQTPLFDAFVYLAAIAARTTRVRLGTYVYNIGLRHPFVTARAVTTLDVISGGRVDLGIGASWLAEEWQAMGLEFEGRGRRVDEAIDVCRRLWTEPVVEHHGEHFDFQPVMFQPKPVQVGGPPLHVGGDTAPALRRAARVGAGWIPMNHRPDQLAASLARLRELCEAYGRADLPEVTMAAPVHHEGDLEALAAAGIDRVIVSPWRSSKDALVSTEAFADRFLR